MSVNTFHQYADPLNAQWVSQLGRHVRVKGVYSGGVITAGTGLYVNVYPVKFEISDLFASSDPLAGAPAVAQVSTNPSGQTLWDDKITSETTDITVVSLTNNATNYIVATWSRSATSSVAPSISATTTFPSNANTLVLGTVTTVSGAVTLITYTNRTVANLPQVHFKVHAQPTSATDSSLNPTLSSGLLVFVNGGRTMVSGASLTVDSALLTLRPAPGAGATRWDLIYLSPTGVLSAQAGNPTTGTPTLPTAGGVPLAKVVVGTSVTSIIDANITDLRPTLGGGFGAVAVAVDAYGASLGKSGYLSLGNNMGVMWGRGAGQTSENANTVGVGYSVNLSAGGKGFSAVHRIMLTPYTPNATAAASSDSWCQLISFVAATFTWRLQNANVGSSTVVYPEWVAIGVTDGTW